MPQNEDSQVPISLMQGYREVLEFRILASYSNAQINVIPMGEGRPLLMMNWVMSDRMMTGRFLQLVSRAQNGVPALADLRMEADAAHIRREAGKMRAYRLAARAYADGRIARQDLANVGIGLTREQREEIGLSVLSERAS